MRGRSSAAGNPYLDHIPTQMLFFFDGCIMNRIFLQNSGEIMTRVHTCKSQLNAILGILQAHRAHDKCQKKDQTHKVKKNYPKLEEPSKKWSRI